MNLQKITRKTRILPVVVFCAAFAVLTFATHLLYQNQAKDEGVDDEGDCGLGLALEQSHDHRNDGE